jgi:hypothetical protein
MFMFFSLELYTIVHYGNEMMKKRLDFVKIKFLSNEIIERHCNLNSMQYKFENTNLFTFDSIQFKFE